MRKRSGFPNGFTLLELLIVVSLIAIMVAFVAPKFRISEAAEVQLAGMQLVQDIDFVRTRALAARSVARVTFDPSGTGAYAGYLDDNADSTIAESAGEKFFLHGFGIRPLPIRVVYGRGSAPALPGLGGSPISFSGSHVEFDTRGVVAPFGTSGVVYLQHANKPSAVVAVAVSAAGNVRLWTFNGGTWQ